MIWIPKDMGTPLRTASYVLYYGKSQNAVALEILRANLFDILSLISDKSVTSFTSLNLELNVYKVKYV